MNHETYYNKAEEAIDRLFSDSSVPPEETLESLRGLQEHINCLIDCDAIKTDMK